MPARWGPFLLRVFILPDLSFSWPLFVRAFIIPSDLTNRQFLAGNGYPNSLACSVARCRMSEWDEVPYDKTPVR